MKKLAILTSILALAACGGGNQNTYIVAATQGEMAARKLESPEQTQTRHNTTLAQANSTLPEGVSFGDTCEDFIAEGKKFNESILVEIDTNNNELKTAFAAFRKKFPNSKADRCSVCKAPETNKLIKIINERQSLLEKPGLWFGGSALQVTNEEFLTKFVDIFNMCKPENSETIHEMTEYLRSMNIKEKYDLVRNMQNTFDCSGACAGETLSNILNNYQ